MSKRSAYAVLAVFLVLSLYSSYSTMGGKSSFFLSTLLVEDKEASTHYDGNNTSAQSQWMAFFNNTQSRIYSSFLSNQTSSTLWATPPEEASSWNNNDTQRIHNRGEVLSSSRIKTITQSVSASIDSATPPAINTTASIVVKKEALPVAPPDVEFNKNWTPPPNQTLSILVQLSGEMGNNIDKIGHGICMQEWLQDEFNTPSTLYFRHQNAGKWTKGRHNTVACFPWTRQFNFAAGNTPSIERFFKSPPEWYSPMMQINSENATEIHEALRFSVQLWRENIANGTAFANATTHDGTPLSQPFLHSKRFVHLHVCMDKYFDVIRERFQFDKEACCDQVPAANETVFHFRNFLGEMVKRGKYLGFEELNPNDTAKLLFANLKAGDRVAITARARDSRAAQPYIDALAKRNISGRVVTSKADVNDFCFLQQAQRELVGHAISTFVTWAGILNNVSAPVRLYSINSFATRKAWHGNWFFSYNWTHPGLRDRISYEGYKQ